MAASAELAGWADQAETEVASWFSARSITRQIAIRSMPWAAKVATEEMGVSVVLPVRPARREPRPETSHRVVNVHLPGFRLSGGNLVNREARGRKVLVGMEAPPL